jgi:hypothetical protein
LSAERARLQEPNRAGERPRPQAAFAFVVDPGGRNVIEASGGVAPFPARTQQVDFDKDHNASMSTEKTADTGRCGLSSAKRRWQGTVAHPGLWVVFAAILTTFGCRTQPIIRGPSQTATLAMHLVEDTPKGNSIERPFRTTSQTVFLTPRAALTHNDIEWAAASVNRTAGPYVVIRFDLVGTDKLALLTRENIGRRMAILINGRVIAAPVIRAEIDSGQVAIPGFDSLSEAERIARALDPRSK